MTNWTGAKHIIPMSVMCIYLPTHTKTYILNIYLKELTPAPNKKVPLAHAPRNFFFKKVPKYFVIPTGALYLQSQRRQETMKNVCLIIKLILLWKIIMQ